MTQTTAMWSIPIPAAEMTVEDKLLFSKKMAERLVKREIRCPHCGFYLMDVYGHEHNITRVKCRKCKFDEVIDTGLFRTMRPRSHQRASYYSGRKPLR